MFRFEVPKGSGKTEAYLTRLQRLKLARMLSKYGPVGVQALAAATPKDTGETSASWAYRVNVSKGSYSIEWYNTHSEGGAPVAVLIQYGHGTGTGGYVSGVDYINPAMRPVFDRIANDISKEVSRG